MLALEKHRGLSALSDEDHARWLVLNKLLSGAYADDAEKRKFFRIQTNEYVRVARSNKKATVSSLSAGGLFIETDISLNEGEIIDLTLELPQRQSVDLDLKAEVRWTKSNGAGLSFISPTSDQQLSIQEKIREQLFINIKEALSTYRFFIDYSPDAALLLNHEFQVIDSNTLAQQCFSIELKEDFRQSLKKLGFKKNIITEIQNCSQRAILTSRSQRYKLCLFQNKKNIHLELLFTASRHHDVIPGVLIVARDVSSLLELETQRQTIEERRYEAERLHHLGKVAAAVAHDINNPLAWTATNLDLLHDYIPTLENFLTKIGQIKSTETETEILTELQQELPGLITEAQEGLKRIQKISCDLRSFTQLEHEGPELVDINHIINLSLRMLKSSLTERASIEFKPGEIPQTYIHSGHISQAIINTLSFCLNSFSTKHRENNLIQIKTASSSNHVLIHIETNNIISTENFDASQPSSQNNKIHSNADKTLSIVKEAFTALSGKISVRPTRNLGTRYSIKLPILFGEHKKKRSSFELSSKKRPIVLILDDEPLLLRSLCRQLQRSCKTFTAERVEDALNILKDEAIDIILCDVMLPESGGEEFYTLATQKRPDLCQRFIFMTGGTFSDRSESFLARQNQAILVKPFSTDDLMHALSEALLKPIVEF